MQTAFEPNTVRDQQRLWTSGNYS